MRKRSKRYSRPSCARALTLIEVVAAIAILGTLLVGVVLTKSRHTRQLHRARTQASAIKAIDTLIAEWWTQPQGVPIDESGGLDGLDHLRWQTRLIKNDPIDQMGARVVRVSVYELNDATSQTRPGDDALLLIDLVVPDLDADEAEQAGAAADRDQSPRKGISDD